jgi:hypothetical protein
MRFTAVSMMALALAFAGVRSPSTHGAAAPAPTDDARLTGTWKLVILGFSFGDHELALVKFVQQDGKPSASLSAAQWILLGSPSACEVSLKGDSVTLTLKSRPSEHEFQGQLVHDGPNAGKFVGSFPLRDELYPARLERTTSQVLAPLAGSPLIGKFYAANRERDAKTKVKKLETMIEDNKGSSNHWLYVEALGAAESAGLKGNEVRTLVERWVEEARPYGETWLSEVRIKALRALAGHKPYAEVSLELAQDAAKAVSKRASAEQTAALEHLLARAATLAEKPDIARDAKARADELERQAAEEYEKKAPSFQPAPYAGRKGPKADRVVMMELFTGAECPPCVAADVAFDALLKAYKPTELIGLEYHLHIPGPDPLTTKDAEARQEYYAGVVNGTPTTCFNGREEASGGGSRSGSEAKHREYRKVIDRELEGRRAATIELSVTRAGDQVKIIAKAMVAQQGDSRDDDTSKKKKSESKLVLRLALTEGAIHYLGGNGMRYHHHVVRAFPGGTQGRGLSSGEGQVTVSVDLAELRRDLERSVDQFARDAGGTKSLPDIVLKDLSVVAFVQDDADKRVLHAVTALVPDVKP